MLDPIVSGRRARPTARFPTHGVDTLVERPVLDAHSIAQPHGVTTTTARTAINRMVEADVLEQANVGLRFRKWIAVDVATALDRFAERAVRRSSA